MKRSPIFLILLAVVSICFFSFQNCARNQFAYEKNSLAGKMGAFSLKDSLIHTDLNTPVDFKISFDGDAAGLSLSLSAGSSIQSLAVANAVIAITNASTYALKYTPKLGFRGKDEFTVYARDSHGESVQGHVIIIVANPISSLWPALSSRGMGCISCHFKSSSNVITDFGLGGDGKGRDYFFGSADHWNAGSPYGDHNNSITTMSFNNPAAKIYVPKASAPSFVVSATGGSQLSLAEYFRQQLSFDTTKPNYQITKDIEVLEKNKITIAAPTENDLKQIFGLTSPQFKYFKEDQRSVDFSGLTQTGTVFKNTAPLNCEGDLAVWGTVHLENLVINSKTGCRIYATGSVYIFGSISYVNKTETSNLQISSANAIFMGLGNVMNSENSGTCEPASGFYNSQFQAQVRQVFDANFNSSFLHRIKTLWTVPFTYLRENLTPLQIGDKLLAELAVVESAVGHPLKDATCRPEGRNVSFERLLLNAPQIHSRYLGPFKGSLIGEHVLMSLSQFTFQYDDVFSKVAVFPMMNSALYLEVK